MRGAEGKGPPLKVDVDVSAGQQAAEPATQRQRKALAPGSFLKHMLGSKHIASDQHFSDIEITAQAFIFLLAGQWAALYACFMRQSSRFPWSSLLHCLCRWGSWAMPHLP